MTINTLSKCLVLAISVLTLAACGDNDMKELRKYVDSVKSKPKLPIEPLPTFVAPERFSYPTEKRRSPFHPVVVEKGERPDAKRPKQALEAFPLDSLRIVGTLNKGSKVWALVTAPDGTVHRVTSGDYIGQNYGKINTISREGMEIVETVSMDGSWVQRPTSLAINSNDDNKG